MGEENPISNLKIALPKGRLLADTADLLEKADWGLDGYVEGARSYRLISTTFPGMTAKVFHEKDIPIQVATGNYDIGICGLDWLNELMSKFPSSELVELRNLGYGDGLLYIAAGRSSGYTDMDSVCRCDDTVRIVSEYTNIAESFALKNRLRRFSIYSLWGSAGAYPPESAELALIRQGEEVPDSDLIPVGDVLNFSACMIANRNSLERVDLSELIKSVDKVLRSRSRESIKTGATPVKVSGTVPEYSKNGILKLALPDGHAQKHTVKILEQAGIVVNDYPSKTGNRRPSTELEGVSIKVVRPQDMPLQVANGNFDLAITGKDWVLDHLYQFPSSPVEDLLDLKASWVRIVVAIDGKMPIETIGELKAYFAEKDMPLRVVSEYVNIADKFGRENHLGLYKVIPTWGSTEAFLPEDADILIDNTETGGTLARHNLRIIDTLFESTARLIGNKQSLASEEKGAKIKSIIKLLKKGIEE